MIFLEGEERIAAKNEVAIACLYEDIKNMVREVAMEICLLEDMKEEKKEVVVVGGVAKKIEENKK